MEPFSSSSKLIKHNDIKKLTKGGNRYGYFLVFYDNDIKDKKECLDNFKKMKESFKKLRSDSPKLRVLFTSRDDCRFKYGFSSKELI